MQILVNSGSFPVTDAIEARVRADVDGAIDRFRDRVTRVEVHLEDINGPKAGVDKRCMMEVRLSGLQPMAVEHQGADLYDAITAAAGKLERAVTNRLGRLGDLHASGH